MKKYFAMVAVAAGMLFAGNVNAQLGVHAGYSPESWTTDNNGSISTTELSSIFAGVDYNMPLTGKLMVSIGGQLRYGTESGEGSFYGLASSKHTTTLVGLDIPVLINFGFNLTSDLKLSVFAGPKVSYYFYGMTKYEGNVLGFGGSSEEDWFDESGLIKYNALNVSGTFGLAFEYQQFRLYGGYNYGLLDMDNNSNSKTTIGGLFFGLGMAL